MNSYKFQKQVSPEVERKLEALEVLLTDNETLSSHELIKLLGCKSNNELKKVIYAATYKLDIWEERTGVNESRFGLMRNYKYD